MKKEYVEAYRQATWKDVREAFFFILKNPELVALAFLVIVFGVSKSVVRDEL